MSDPPNLADLRQRAMEGQDLTDEELALVIASLRKIRTDAAKVAAQPKPAAKAANGKKIIIDF